MKKPTKKKATQTEMFAPAPAASPEALALVERLASELAAAIADLPMPGRVDALNRARMALHEVSPFRGEPVDCVLWFPQPEVTENDWNPNAVPPPEFVALTHSVKRFGYTMPIVGVRIPEPAVDSPIRVRITDGKHRNIVGRVDPEIRERLHGYLPLSLLQSGLTRADEMSATILHNEARGTHAITKEVAIVEEMAAAGWDAEKIGVGTVKTSEELVRIGQLAAGGAAANLASKRYAKAWTFER